MSEDIQRIKALTVNLCSRNTLKLTSLRDPGYIIVQRHDALKEILGNQKFLPSYCLERASFMKEYPEGAYAVVCFADLMRDEVERHMASFHADLYIVMDKKWAREQFIAPVLYYVNGSIPSTTLKAWLLKLVEQKEKDEMGVSLRSATS